jgi:hypothetical protein
MIGCCLHVWEKRFVVFKIEDNEKLLFYGREELADVYF